MFQKDRDYSDYKSQRRKEHKKVARDMQSAPEDDGMFFGASPKQKKELRETVDKRGINLDSLDLNALDREKYNAPEKVGKSLRLIDMAMSDSGPMKALTREEVQRRAVQARRAKAQGAARAKAQAAARAKAQAAARAQAAAKAKAQAAVRSKAQAAARARAQAAAKAKTKLSKRPPAPKPPSPKATKRGVKIEDMGLKKIPRKVRPSGRIKRGGPRR